MLSENNPIEAIEFLSQYLTERRKTLIDQVLDKRTRHITVVLEDVLKPQNASAVLRTCECQGIQDIYIIENNHLYEVNPDVVRGAAKWLTIHNYPKSGDNNTPMCYNDLRSRGYTIVATDPKGERTIDELDIDEPVALVFGTEYHGLSETAKFEADKLVTIPIQGFTESYNLSVSAAICLQSTTSRLRASTVKWTLSSHEINELKLNWYRDHVRDADRMLTHHFGS